MADEGARGCSGAVRRLHSGQAVAKRRRTGQGPCEWKPTVAVPVLVCVCVCVCVCVFPCVLVCVGGSCTYG